jgi:hypothetical protein
MENKDKEAKDSKRKRNQASYRKGSKYKKNIRDMGSSEDESGDEEPKEKATQRSKTRLNRGRY